MTVDLAPYGRAVYLLDHMLADGVDADDLVRQALTTVGRMFDGLDDDEVAATLHAVAEMAKVWPLAPEQLVAAESVAAQDEPQPRSRRDPRRAAAVADRRLAIDYLASKQAADRLAASQSVGSDDDAQPAQPSQEQPARRRLFGAR